MDREQTIDDILTTDLGDAMEIIADMKVKLAAKLAAKDVEIYRLQAELVASEDRAGKYMNDSIRQQEKLGELALKHGIQNV